MPTARRRLSPEDRRAELLALGAEVFGKRPYDEVRIDEIAERAGVSRALMYHYFPDKRAFFAAVVRDEADRLYAATNNPPPVGINRVEAGFDMGMQRDRQRFERLLDFTDAGEHHAFTLFARTLHRDVIEPQHDIL